jgi:hypothetical protein
MRRILDLPATRASQIAPEKGLQHQDKGIALTALEFLFQDVRGYRPHLGNWYWHCCAYTLDSLINSLSAVLMMTTFYARLFLSIVPEMGYFCLGAFLAGTMNKSLFCRC